MDEDMTKDEYYDNMLEFGIVTSQEIALVTSIAGDTKETYKAMLYVRTGYRSWKQLMQE